MHYDTQLVSILKLRFDWHLLSVSRESGLVNQPNVPNLTCRQVITTGNGFDQRFVADLNPAIFQFQVPVDITTVLD